MTDHDDLDRKIRALFGRAGNDSPAPLELRPNQDGLPSRRWLAVAAAAVVLVAGIAVISRHDSGRSASSPGVDPTSASAPRSTNSETNLTTVLAFESSTAAPIGSSTVPPTHDCSAVAPAGYDEFGTIHTISPNSLPVDVTITADGDRWCAGGRGSVTVTFHNRGVDTVTVDRPTLILSNGPEKWTMAELRDSLTLRPDERVSIPADVVAPLAPPGDYTVAVYGFLDSNVPITIEGLPVCDGSMLNVSVSNLGSASGNLRTDVTVKNTTPVPCILPRPVSVVGMTAARTTATPIQFTDSIYFGDPPSPSITFLPPGHSATLWLDTTITGVCGTPSPGWAQLDLTLRFDPRGAAIPLQVVSPGKPFDTGCGLGVSAWGLPS